MPTTSHGQPQEEKKTVPSFKDISQKRFEGNQISPRQLIDSGQEFTIYRFEKLKSKFNKQDYAAVQIELGGEKYYFNTSSTAIMDQLQKNSGHMPYKAKIAVMSGKEGQQYMKLK